MDNEEKILMLLEGLTATVAKQGEQLAKQGERLEEMQETLTRVAVTQEGVVLPRIQMLFDGHSELKRELDTLATKEQVEELSADVSVIKDVVSRHSVDIGKLKRAQ